MANNTSSILFVSSSGNIGISGNVGIGTTIPSVPLHVIGAATVSTTLSVGTLQIGSSGIVINGSILGLQATANLAWSNDSFGNDAKDTNISRVRNGVVGIGTGTQGSIAGTLAVNNIGIGGITSPSASLHISGSTIITNDLTVTGSINVVSSISSSLFTGSLVGNATSASYALTSSYVSPYQPYVTLNITNSWITCSFNTPEQYAVITTGSLFNFTQSNLPAAGNVSNIVLVISHSAPQTSSLVFPSNWKFIGSLPTNITSSKFGVLSLKSYGDGITIIGSFSTQY